MWIYFERDIKSPTEIMRSPWPTKGGGFPGIAYCAGEPDVCDTDDAANEEGPQGLTDGERDQWRDESLDGQE